jgi:hypothetical protein
MRQLLVIHDRKKFKFLYTVAPRYLSMLAARVHVRYSSNYWDSCRDHAVFGRIAFVIVEKYFLLLLFDRKFTGQR